VSTNSTCKTTSPYMDISHTVRSRVNKAIIGVCRSCLILSVYESTITKEGL
jgi:hypothetical protein